MKAAVDDGLYADAVKAIDRRDYGNALELLQAARDRTPEDVRVLNAFGVVYDKLGRFDLSGRYYAQAAALDPGSSIVANNESYSRVLQARAAAGDRFATPAEVRTASAAPTPTSAPAPAPVVRSAPAAAPVTVASAAPKPAPVKPAPLRIWPTESATLKTVSLQLQALQPAHLPGALLDRTADTIASTAPELAAPELPASERPALIHGAAPQPLLIAANETVSVQVAAYDSSLDVAAASPLDSFQAAAEPVRAPISRAVAATLQTAAADEAPQMGRVVPDGPGRVKLVPGPRQTAAALAYAPHSVMTLDGPAPRAAGPALLASSGRIVEVAPGVLRLEGAAHPTMVALARAPGLTGYPLAVIDASGRVDGAKATITRLASLGWTARVAPPTPSRQHSTIYYEAGDHDVAQGLARTLAIPVQLAACEQACRGVTLVVGADAVEHPVGRG
ncbi:MAG TPA: LytR C-terminal domain-containing protein [Caulobacteraceae bacterium]